MKESLRMSNMEMRKIILTLINENNKNLLFNT